ncbi:EAL and HDOD domain-containing protein [Noviherbaspirillum saxi]|uniref:EAL and HDOD domain-containing protein n=1 Tax=Noviherbaspirillum saxi TaxID=2320863 RepID=UPI001313E38A|nr:HDOD domain-containing protein [Noviherbaspirillum saxi]
MPSPLAAIDLLANRNKELAALMIHIAAVDESSMAVMTENEQFQQLAGRFPCLVAQNIAAGPIGAALEAAGCQAFPADGALLAHDSLPPVLPAATRYLAGRWYLARPAKPSGSQAASRALALQLVQLVVADADTHEIEAVLRRDPALSYHLLRLVNSLGMGMSRQITSFSQAILILGRAQLRRWLNLMLFSSRSGDDRSAMLLARVAVRARCMELLAKAGGMDKSGQELAFMAGMFSLLGILFGMPLAEVLKPLKVSETLLSALLDHQGELGMLLQLMEASERADFTALLARLDELHVPADEYHAALIEAHIWMLDVISESNRA